MPGGTSRSLVPALFSISLATFLVFKVLALYMNPVNLLIGLVLIAHPCGVVFAQRRYPSEDDRGRALRHYLVVLALTLALLPVLARTQGSHYEWNSPSIGVFLLRILGAGIYFVPLFFMSGAVEYMALRGAGSRGLAYGSLLFAAMLGIAVGYLALPQVGVLGIVLVSLAAAGWPLQPSRRVRAGVFGLVSLALVLLALVPAVDRTIVRQIQPRGPETASALAERARLEWGGWGKYQYVQFFRDDAGVLSGVYNNSAYWDFTTRANPNFVGDRVVMDLLPAGGRLAIVGAGGGRQVAAATDANKQLEVDAFELEPAVIDYLTRIDPDANARTYLQPGVRVFAREGRAGVAESDREYDAIYLADPGNFFHYYRTMLDFAFFLHTREAYASYVEQLRPGGFLAVLVLPGPAAPAGQRIINIMRALELEVVRVPTRHFDLLVAARAGELDATQLAALAARHGLALEHPQADLTLDNPIPTDDRGGSYIYALYPLPLLARFFALGVAAISLASLLLARWFRARASGPTLPGLAPLFVLLGLNFILLENVLVLQIARLTFNASDAAILGTLAFLLAAASGACLSDTFARRMPLYLALLAPAILACVVALRLAAPLPWLLAAEAMLFVLSGALFPIALELAGGTRLAEAFAADSMGATLGALTVLFTPVLYGIDALSHAALLVTSASALVLVFVRWRLGHAGKDWRGLARARRER